MCFFPLCTLQIFTTVNFNQLKRVELLDDHSAVRVHANVIRSNVIVLLNLHMYTE